MDYKHYREVIKPSMRRKVDMHVPPSDVEDVLSDFQGRFLDECEQKPDLTPGELYRNACRKCYDAIADYYRKKGGTPTPLGSGSEEGFNPSDPTPTDPLIAAAIKEQLERYRQAKAWVLDPSNPYYEGKDPLLPLYDSKLIRAWEEDPTKSVRGHGRLLQKFFADHHPDSVFAGHDETYACRRLANFIDRIRKKLGGK